MKSNLLNFSVYKYMDGSWSKSLSICCSYQSTELQQFFLNLWFMIDYFKTLGESAVHIILLYNLKTAMSHYKNFTSSLNPDLH